FDLSDPHVPVQIATQPDQRMLGQPMGIDGIVDQERNVHTIAIVTGPAAASLPSNLRLFDVEDVPVSPPAPPASKTTWVAAAPLSHTAVDGIVRKVVVHGSFAYAITTFKGVQVVDLDFARQFFTENGGGSSQMRIDLNTDGVGWGQEAVVGSIPVLKPTAKPY